MDLLAMILTAVLQILCSPPTDIDSPGQFDDFAPENLYAASTQDVIIFSSNFMILKLNKTNHVN